MVLAFAAAGITGGCGAGDADAVPVGGEVLGDADWVGGRPAAGFSVQLAATASTTRAPTNATTKRHLIKLTPSYTAGTRSTQQGCHTAAPTGPPQAALCGQRPASLRVLANQAPRLVSRRCLTPLATVAPLLAYRARTAPTESATCQKPTRPG